MCSVSYLARQISPGSPHRPPETRVRCAALDPPPTPLGCGRRQREGGTTSSTLPPLIRPHAPRLWTLYSEEIERRAGRDRRGDQLREDARAAAPPRLRRLHGECPPRRHRRSTRRRAAVDEASGGFMANARHGAMDEASTPLRPNALTASLSWAAAGLAALPDCCCRWRPRCCCCLRLRRRYTYR